MHSPDDRKAGCTTNKWLGRVLVLAAQVLARRDSRRWPGPLPTQAGEPPRPPHASPGTKRRRLSTGYLERVITASTATLSQTLPLPASATARRTPSKRSIPRTKRTVVPTFRFGWRCNMSKLAGQFVFAPPGARPC